MRIDLYERIWMWGAVVLIVIFVSALLYSAGAQAVRPPSHVETIDPAKIFTDSDFSRFGVTVTEDGEIEVRIVALMFVFLPNEIRVPHGRPIKFRLTSSDVIHGFQIVSTNANSTVIPGYVSQFRITFPEAGEYLIVCNEFCGLGHHVMQAKLIVE